MLQGVFFKIFSPASYFTVTLLAYMCVCFEVDMVDKVGIYNYLHDF